MSKSIPKPKNAYIEYLLKEKGLSVTQMARDLGFYSQNISNWRINPQLTPLWFIVDSSRRYEVERDALVNAIYETFPDDWLKWYIKHKYFCGTALSLEATSKRRTLKLKRRAEKEKIEALLKGKLK